MAFNGSGTFVRVHSWATDKTNSVKITASRQDTEDDGFATGLSNTICRDGQSTVTANIPMNSKKFTGLAAGTTAGDSARYEQVTSAVAITGGTIAGITDLAVADGGTGASTAANARTNLAAAGTGVANTFTANQTLQSTDAGSAAGPLVLLDRNSASPAVDDVIGGMEIYGRDSGANSTLYARLLGRITDPTDTSEDGRFLFQTVIAGTFTTRMELQDGLYMTGATGNDQGAGTINASAVFDDGVALCAPIEEFVTGTYDAAAWAALAPYDGLATYEAMKARGYDPKRADSFAGEITSHKGIPGYWNKAEWEARIARTKKDHKGNDIIDRVSHAEVVERLLLALDLQALAIADLTARITALESA